MAAVTLSNVHKRFDDGTVGVRDLSLDIADGELMVLVGPSGCGKSTALRIIAGLENVTDGELSIGGRRVTDLPPGARNVAMVFQNYALYPHLSVRQNMGFALEMAKVDKTEIRRRVDNAARVLDLTEQLERKPSTLSGGQRQRVAMGRAIVREPSVFLMDEPLSNLDAKLRVHMRASIVELQRQLATTMVYVTHDQLEAMMVGDRVAVMRRGALQQVDDPQLLYEYPANLFVAGFIGSPAMNFLHATLERDATGRFLGRFGRHALGIDPACAAQHPRLADYVGRAVILGVRPEHFEHGRRSVLPDDQRLDIAVEVSEVMGSETHVHFNVDVPPVLIDGVTAEPDDGELPLEVFGTRLTARLEGIVRVAAAETLQLGVRTAFAYLFDPETGLPLR